MHAPYRMLSGENISSRFVVPTVAACLDLVVHLGIDAEGQRRVREIVGVPGRVEDGVIEIEPVFEMAGGQLTRTRGAPPRAELFAQAGFDLPALLRGD